MKQRTEVLAPAGDMETLYAAIDAGADAVYVGGARFGARAYAKNFLEKELLQAIDYVHLHGKKLYLTVNTLVKEREFSDLYQYLLPYYIQGLDAVIVQDLGVMDAILNWFPEMDVHASTQMTVTNAVSAKYLEYLGVKRVVPARELSLKEIQEIHQETNLEVECFVHGALCYCYSGQCLLSSMIGGRSGNRGQCAQPCRLAYQVEGMKKEQDILSLKDLCTIEQIPELIENGITSFKIEGRMKQPSYVATVTKMYRRYVDLYEKVGKQGYYVSEEDKRELHNVYQRRGYTDGYYHRHNGREMLSLTRPESKAQNVWIPEAKKQEKINGNLILSCGEDAKLYLECGEVRIEATGAKAERAAKQPLSRERIEKQIKKTGNTPFIFEKLEIQINGDVFLPIQALNELRRYGLEQLERRIVEKHRRRMPDRKLAEFEGSAEKAVVSENEGAEISSKQEWFVTALTETVGQFRAVMKNPVISRIYVEDTLWTDRKTKDIIKPLILQARTCGKQVYFAMARIFRIEARTVYDREFTRLMNNFDGVLVRNLESYLYVRERSRDYPVITDSSVYEWNVRAKKWWKNQKNVSGTAPIELNYWELKELGIQDMEFIVYGYLPVMITASCIRKHTGECRHESGILRMRDRYHKENIIKNECSYCYNVIYNVAPLMLFDQNAELKKLKPAALRFQFSIEDEEQTDKILKCFQDGMKTGAYSFQDMEYTRGHFKRGVK